MKIQRPKHLSEMGDGKYSVLHYNGTDGQDEKHSLQIGFEIMNNTRAKNGCVC
jgi:hypothetical protein